MESPSSPDAPNAVPPPDLEYLRLLGIFHYVVAGITALFASFPLIHVFLGFMMITGRMGPKHPNGDTEQLMGWAFVGLGCLFVASGWALAVFMAVAGNSILKRRRHTLCVIVAGVSCLFMPFGTILGVFTLILLTKPHVKALFEPPAPRS